MLRICCLFLFTILSSSIANAQLKDFTAYVNPFIGTGGHGHTYPGVAMPFGMVQLSPDTRLDGWDGCGGYHYSDSVIYGFSHTHLSGTGVSDYGDLLLMPFTGITEWESGYPNSQGYGAKFSHQSEEANAGYYKVELFEDDIKVELTTTQRCGIHRYTFPEWETKKLLLDLNHRDKVLDADLIFMNDSTIIGKRISEAWATEQHFYFAIQFSEAVKDRVLTKNKQGKPTQLALQFGHLKKELIVKIGASAVDIKGALNNLKKEGSVWDFDSYLAENKKVWNQELSKLQIQTDDKDELSIFYTAVYHSYLNPNLFSDVDSRYRGMDQQIHTAADHSQYTVFSLWDTFRATHPLFTIMQTEKTVDFINTFLNQYKDGGILPIWELSANYTHCMIGYHAIPVIVDAYNKGIRKFDHELALKAMIHSAEQDHLGLKDYKKAGFISSENESESVSKTLEYAYDDWCIAIFADSLGHDSIASIYYKRAQYYKNLYHPDSKFMQPRFNGGWKDNFKPSEVTFDFTEANSWQYSLFVPQDINGLIELLGGADSLELWLDNLFSAKPETTGRHQVDITGLIGQYAHGNEPSHHMAYLYNFTHSPWKTNHYVNRIFNEMYSNAPDGLSGNEDCGQMSSWYVLSALGFYSLTPGSDYYALGCPRYKLANLSLENGKEFRVIAENLTEKNIYIESIYINGSKVDRNFIRHSEIMAGGELKFIMTNSKTDIAFKEMPLTKINNQPFLRAPTLSNSVVPFTKKKVIKFEHIADSTEIRYTLDGSEPLSNSKKYKAKGIKIKETTTLKAISVKQSLQSLPTTAYFVLTNNDWSIKLKSTFHDHYSGGGERALIDQIYGNTDFRTGSWQGFFDQDLDVEIDLGKIQDINSIGINLLQDAKSWIWYPSEVSFQISNDGIEWFTLGTVLNEFPRTQLGSFIQPFKLDKTVSTRFIRIIAKNPGPCPEWHPGAGNPSYIFADEISID